MEYGQTLIDKAAKVCGSFYKLSKATGFPESNMSAIKAGRRALPLEWVPELAEIAGEDPRDALARVMAERLPEGSRARAILGGVRAAGVAAMLLFFVSLALLQPSNGYAKTRTEIDLLYIVEHAISRLWSRLKSLFSSRFLHDRLGRSLRKPPENAMGCPGMNTGFSWHESWFVVCRVPAVLGPVEVLTLGYGFTPLT